MTVYKVYEVVDNEWTFIEMYDNEEAALKHKKWLEVEYEEEIQIEVLDFEIKSTFDNSTTVKLWDNHIEGMCSCVTKISYQHYKEEDFSVQCPKCKTTYTATNVHKEWQTDEWGGKYFWWRGKLVKS